MINVLVLMAGPDQAFKDEGYAFPKNLVEIDGQPLVQRVLNHLSPLKSRGARFICTIRHDENSRHHTGQVIRLIDPLARLVEIKGNTSGAACSALLAAEHINTSAPLLIVNGDQLLLNVDLAGIVAKFQDGGLDGGIAVFEDVHPRWSFVLCDENGLVVETAEKRPISNLATAGFYYFAKGADFVSAAMEMIKKNADVDGSFYICPTYNELILRQLSIGVHRIPRRSYFSLATPSDITRYQSSLTH